jgi:hypothetical protein
MAPSFDTLRSAAARGPVIIINHCKWRSDIIILLHDSPPSLIPVTKDFYSRAEEMRDQLFRARRQGLDSKEYELVLSSVLEGLYDLVGQPVIERLRMLNVQEQSRIWWCPTSVFCSLPLHAMGPVRSDGHVKLYFSDLYITSYTPTLSTLIEARKPSAQTSTEPSILLVAQPDATMPNVLQEMRVVQAVSPSVATLLWEQQRRPPRSSTSGTTGLHIFRAMGYSRQASHSMLLSSCTRVRASRYSTSCAPNCPRPNLRSSRLVTRPSSRKKALRMRDFT